MTKRRLLKRVGVGLLGLAAVAVLVGSGWEAAMRRHTRRAIPMSGQLVDVGGGRRLQLDCRGRGSPTVVLEAGLDVYGSLSWVSVHDSLARTSRVCAYSRAGILWSDGVSGTMDARASSRDLHAALLRAGESAPWVLVGHSLGGPYAMTFAALFDREVAGMVFVDASHPDQFARFREATGKALEPTTGELRIGSALAWTGLVRALAPSAMPAGWPNEVGRISNAYLPTSIDALARETAGVPATLAIAGEHRSLGGRPLVVLASGRRLAGDGPTPSGMTAEQSDRLRSAARALIDDEARWSTRSRLEVVEGASHYIQFDRPDAVIRAVREVVASVRDGGSTLQPPQAPQRP